MVFSDDFFCLVPHCFAENVIGVQDFALGVEFDHRLHFLDCADHRICIGLHVACLSDVKRVFDHFERPPFGVKQCLVGHLKPARLAAFADAFYLPCFRGAGAKPFPEPLVFGRSDFFGWHEYVVMLTFKLFLGIAHGVQKQLIGA